MWVSIQDLLKGVPQRWTRIKPLSQLFQALFRLLLRQFQNVHFERTRCQEKWSLGFKSGLYGGWPLKFSLVCRGEKWQLIFIISLKILADNPDFTGLRFSRSRLLFTFAFVHFHDQAPGSTNSPRGCNYTINHLTIFKYQFAHKVNVMDDLHEIRI